jgi:hypothetical protein
MTELGKSKHSEALRAAIAAKWKAGTATRRIADEVGLSHGVVMGLIHRMRLVPRPSPIKPRCRDDVHGCQWIDDRAKCGLPGYPYCAAHRVRAYVKKKSPPRSRAFYYKPKYGWSDP